MLSAYLETALGGEDYDRAQAQQLLLALARALFQNTYLHPQQAWVCVTTRVGGELGFTWYAWLVADKLVDHLPPGLCDWCVPLPAVFSVLLRYGRHLTCSLEQLGQWDSSDDWPPVGSDREELHQPPAARDNDSEVPGPACPANNP